MEFFADAVIINGKSEDKCMRIEGFIAGQYKIQNDFKTFYPTPINTGWEWDDPKIGFLLEQASAELGGLNSFSDLIPNVDVYIKMHIRTEANKSSKIEGTNTSIEEDFMKPEDISPEKRNDHEEVSNYIQALNYGIDRIVNDDFPLCNRLICEIHGELMQGVRGKHKNPGEFRRSQNWIGGTMPSNAVYVPPNIIDMQELLSDFEKFINNDSLNVPHLIKIAIIHYQFESIHPFLDGNGRIGRLLIPLYLLSKKALDKPCFYISDYFENNRDAYYDALHRVRIYNDISHWIKFFLEAVIQTAKAAKLKFKNVVSLVEKYKSEALIMPGRAANNQKILESFFDKPYLTGREVQKFTGLSQPTVDKTISIMLDNNMLFELTGFGRNRIFVLHEYVDIFLKTQ